MRLAGAMAAVLAGCGGQSVFIAGHQGACYGPDATLCLQVDEGDGELVNFDRIEGFDFVWGLETEARIRSRRVLNPPADGSSVRYRLAEIIETRPVDDGSTFVWNLPPDPNGIEFLDPERQTLLDGTPYRCQSPTVCDAAASAIQANEGIDVTFAFIEGQIVLTGVSSAQ